MDFKKYQEQAKRTCPDLENHELDIAHMLYGLMSELSELIEAVQNKDYVNINEEYGDKFWYLANLCSKLNIDIRDVSFFGVKSYKVSGTTTIEQIAYCIGQICNLEKRKIAYKKLYTIDDIKYEIERLVYTLISSFRVLGIDMDLMYALTKNIDKLKQRYPDKFNEENALNRDLDKERQILES